MEKIKILGISGSLRKDSLNTKLLKCAGKVLSENAEFDIVDISGVPIYNGDVEALGASQAVKDLEEKIQNADAVLIVTPEYNYSIPGVLKNTIDWLSRSKVLNHKIIAIMGASPGMLGTVRAQLHLREMLLFMRAKIFSEKEFYFSRADARIDESGELKDENDKKFLKDFMDGFVKFIEENK